MANLTNTEKLIDLIDNIKIKLNELEDAIPVKLSELENDEGFITKAVNDLINYYNKDEVNDLLEGIVGLELVKVDTLPATGENGKIYLVPSTSVIDTYDEYIWVSHDSAFEKIGNLHIDFSDYYTKIEVDALIDDKQDKFIAGEGIKIEEKSNMQGPCPDGRHIPTKNEWQRVLDLLVNLGITMTQGSRMKEVLMLAYNNYRARNTASQGNQRIMTYFWTCTPYGTDGVALCFKDSGPAFNPQFKRANACSIRPFKDTPLMPNEDDWTNLHGTLDAGIWRNASLSVISITYNGEIITLADKNLGATQVSYVGDAPTNANSGNYYQRGNNYGFPGVETNVSQITKSSTLVDTTGYGPDNWYSSDVFVLSETTPFDWSSPKNDNLWGGLGTETRTVMENTGVLSVNGQTGHVTVSGGDSDVKQFIVSNATQLLNTDKHTWNMIYQHVMNGGIAVIKDIVNENAIWTQMWTAGDSDWAELAFVRITADDDGFAEFINSTYVSENIDDINYFKGGKPFNPINEGTAGQILTRYGNQYRWENNNAIAKKANGNITINSGWLGTKQQFNQIQTKDNSCIYFAED